MEVTNGGKVRVGLPPLIATADMENSTASISDTKLQYKQFFATGVAASFLASQPDIRNVLGVKILNDANLKKVLESRENFQSQSQLSREIITAFKDLSETGKQVSVFDKAIALGIIDDSLKSKTDSEKASSSLFPSRLTLYVNKNNSDGPEKLRLLQAHIVTNI